MARRQIQPPADPEMAVVERTSVPTVREIRGAVARLGLGKPEDVTAKNKMEWQRAVVAASGNRCDERKRVAVEIVEESYKSCPGGEVVTGQKRSRLSAGDLSPSSDLHNLNEKYLSSRGVKK